MEENVRALGQDMPPTDPVDPVEVVAQQHGVLLRVAAQGCGSRSS